MSEVVTIENVIPAPRYDNRHWHHVDIQESASQIGPWTTIDMFTLAAEPTPATPGPQNFTTENGTAPGLWYRIIFFDDTGGEQSATGAVQNVPDEAVSYMPTVLDVAKRLRSRTKDRNGNYVGTFTGETTPTFTDVENLIEQATDDVTALTDTDVPRGAWRHMRAAIAIRAAMLVELGYFSEQVSTNRSIYPQLEADYREVMPLLGKAIEREQTEIEHGESGMPAGEIIVGDADPPVSERAYRW